MCLHPSPFPKGTDSPPLPTKHAPCAVSDVRSSPHMWHPTSWIHPAEAFQSLNFQEGKSKTKGLIDTCVCFTYKRNQIACFESCGESLRNNLQALTELYFWGKKKERKKCRPWDIPLWHLRFMFKCINGTAMLWVIPHKSFMCFLKYTRSSWRHARVCRAVIYQESEQIPAHVASGASGLGEPVLSPLLLVQTWLGETKAE